MYATDMETTLDRVNPRTGHAMPRACPNPIIGQHAKRLRAGITHMPRPLPTRYTPTKVACRTWWRSLSDMGFRMGKPGSVALKDPIHWPDCALKRTTVSPPATARPQSAPIQPASVYPPHATLARTLPPPFSRQRRAEGKTRVRGNQEWATGASNAPALKVQSCWRAPRSCRCVPVRTTSITHPCLPSTRLIFHAASQTPETSVGFARERSLARGAPTPVVWPCVRYATLAPSTRAT